MVLGGAGLAVVGTVGGVGLWAWPKLVPPPAEIGFDLSENEIADALVFLQDNPAVDSHAHPGRTFVRGAHDLTWKLYLYQKFGTFEERVIEDMRAGGMAAVSFSAVADFPVLDLRGQGLETVRQFRPGEAWDYYKAQLANLAALTQAGLVYPVLEPGDVALARASGKPGAIFAVEGGDFIEGDASRIGEAFRDGVRMVTLVHYLRGSKLGDIMTKPPVHGGITDLGRAVIREMNRAGIMLDLSHSSEKTAFGALEETTTPAVATHTHLNSLGIGHPRFISPDLAKAIAATGGYIGAWPAGIGIHSLNGFIERIGQLVETVGVDHVAIGSDMDANYKPVFENYRKMPLIVGAMFKRGYSKDEVARIIGGNFLRVFEATLATRRAGGIISAQG
jgi:membrane dipeptidase